MRKRLVIGLAVVACLLMPVWIPLLWRAATMPLDPARIAEIATGLGIAGPLLIVGLVAGVGGQADRSVWWWRARALWCSAVRAAGHRAAWRLETGGSGPR